MNFNEFEDGEIASTPEPCLSLGPGTPCTPESDLSVGSKIPEPANSAHPANIPSQESNFINPAPVSHAPKDHEDASKPSHIQGSVSCSKSRSKHHLSSRPSQFCLNPAQSEPESDHDLDKSRKRKKLKKRRDVKVTGSDESDDDDVPRSKSKKKRKDKSPNHSTHDKSKPKDSCDTRNMLSNKHKIGISSSTVPGVIPRAAPEPVPGAVPGPRGEKLSRFPSEKKHSKVSVYVPGQNSILTNSKHSAHASIISRDSKYSTSSKLDKTLQPPLPPVVINPPPPKPPANTAAARFPVKSQSPARSSEPSSSYSTSNTVEHKDTPKPKPSSSPSVQRSDIKPIEDSVSYPGQDRRDPCDEYSPALSDGGLSDKDFGLKDQSESMEEEGKVEVRLFLRYMHFI